MRTVMVAIADDDTISKRDREGIAFAALNIEALLKVALAIATAAGLEIDIDIDCQLNGKTVLAVETDDVAETTNPKGDDNA
jgi:hypothetical protein